MRCGFYQNSLTIFCFYIVYFLNNWTVHVCRFPPSLEKVCCHLPISSRFTFFPLLMPARMSQRSKGRRSRHTVTKTVTVARLLVMRAAMPLPAWVCMSIQLPMFSSCISFISKNKFWFLSCLYRNILYSITSTLVYWNISKSLYKYDVYIIVVIVVIIYNLIIRIM